MTKEDVWKMVEASIKKTQEHIKNNPKNDSGDYALGFFDGLMEQKLGKKDGAA